MIQNVAKLPSLVASPLSTESFERLRDFASFVASEEVLPVSYQMLVSLLLRKVTPDLRFRDRMSVFVLMLISGRPVLKLGSSWSKNSSVSQKLDRGRTCEMREFGGLLSLRWM